MCARASRREKPAFLKRLDTRTKGDDTDRNSAQFRECRPHHCSRGAGLPFLLPDLPFGGHTGTAGRCAPQTDRPTGLPATPSPQRPRPTRRGNITERVLGALGHPSAQAGRDEARSRAPVRGSPLFEQPRECERRLERRG